MSDVEELERALAAAEADEHELSRAAVEVTRAREALTATALGEAQARRDALSASLRALRDEEQALEEARVALLAKVSRSRLHLPAFLTGPARWTVNIAAFTFYVGCVLNTYRGHHSPGLTLAVVIALPIAFIALLVAGSMRESFIDERAAHGEGPAGAPRGDAGAGEGAAPPALDAGPDVSAPGGPRAPGEPEGGAGAAGGPPGRGEPPV